MQLLSADLALARRLEAAEAANGFAMAAAQPKAESAEIAGGCALFGGVESPFTHALGIGMKGHLPEGEFDRLERFYFERGSDCLIDLCPMADITVLDEVMKRSYRIIEFNNVMVRPVYVADAKYEAPVSLEVRLVEEAEESLWRHNVARGFTGLAEPPAEVLEMMGSIRGYAEAILAKGGGAAMSVREGVAMFYGDATVEEERGKGIQMALIRARLARAATQGADLAMACVLPGSGSHRNYERAGFTLAYMRVNVRRSPK